MNKTTLNEEMQDIINNIEKFVLLNNDKAKLSPKEVYNNWAKKYGKKIVHNANFLKAYDLISVFSDVNHGLLDDLSIKRKEQN